jgi:arsenate reductase
MAMGFFEHFAGAPTSPVIPGRRYAEWLLPDPAGQSVDAVRPIRDGIEQRVRGLLDQLGVSPTTG